MEDGGKRRRIMCDKSQRRGRRQKGGEEGIFLFVQFPMGRAHLISLICSVCIRCRVCVYMLAQVLSLLPLSAILFALGYTLAKLGHALRTNK